VQVHARFAYVNGDFTEWKKSSKEMSRQKNGRFLITLSLPAAQDYYFRCLLDGGRWENDWAADASVPNPFGTEDSVLKL